MKYRNDRFCTDSQEQKLRAKEQVLGRMQRFKRVTPPCLVHTKEEASVESAVQPSEKPSHPVQGKIRSRIIQRIDTANNKHSAVVHWHVDSYTLSWCVCFRAC